MAPHRSRFVVIAITLLSSSALAGEGSGAPEANGPLAEIVGGSRAMVHIHELIARYGPHDETVLITGETGTGKELVARALHATSPRSEGRFVAVNCAALPPSLLESELFGHKKGAFTGAHERKGHFEYANGGTLFLDEIGRLSRSGQDRLLRVLESRKLTPIGSSDEIDLDVRVISATNRDLEQRSARGRFALDLLYRLDVLRIRTPSLRERLNDIPELARHLLVLEARKRSTVPTRITPGALGILQQHRWPGNVRELRNVLTRLVIAAQGEPIDVKHVTAEFAPAPSPINDGPLETALLHYRNRPLGELLADVKRSVIVRALEEHGNHRKRVAQSLGIGTKALYVEMKRLNIRAPYTKGPRRKSDSPPHLLPISTTRRPEFPPPGTRAAE